jgi:hypothetical protein
MGVAIAVGRYWDAVHSPIPVQAKAVLRLVKFVYDTEYDWLFPLASVYV